MESVARAIVEHSKRILALTGVITLVAVLMLFRMDFNADVASFVLEGNDTGEEFQALQEKYATADPINVVASLPAGETFASVENITRLFGLRESLSQIEGVEQVVSIIPEVNPLTGAAISPADIAAGGAPVIAVLLAQNPFADLLLAPSGSDTMLMVVPGDDGLAVAQDVADVAAPAGIELTLSGNPVVFSSVIDILSLFLLLIPPAVFILLIAVFYATIGDRRLSVMAMVPAILGSVWTFGLIFALGREVDIVTVIVPIFVIVMGSADGLHFVTHFQEEAETSKDTVQRVQSALSHVGVPMILTTISTAAGFFSLIFTNVQPIEQLGMFTAIGIVFAGFISFFSLPALLSRLTIEPRHHDALIGPRVTRGLKRLVATRTSAIVISAGLLAFAAVAVPRLAVNPDQLFFFKDDDPVRLAFEKTEELFGGATPLIGEFAFNPANGAAGLATADAVSAEMESLPGVRSVFSVADLAAALPPDQLEAVVAGTVDLPLGKMVSDDGLRFMLLPSDFTTEDLRTWIDFAENRDEVTALTGMPVVWDEIARLVLRAQVVSLIVAIILVAIMLALAYRRLRQTLVALAPVAMTVLTMLGFIAVSGIQLNLLTAVVSGIVIGVGIDYSIHFIAAIDNARRDGPGYVLRAIDRAGRPIVANGLGIAVALTALWLSPLKIHSQVSMIMWVAMITAALTAIVIISALLPEDGQGGGAVPEPSGPATGALDAADGSSVIGIGRGAFG
ncbi:MAG: MMPL family transporter [bacterium]|nr:MMPL family transporter [bacterium]